MFPFAYAPGTFPVHFPPGVITYSLPVIHTTPVRTSAPSSAGGGSSRSGLSGRRGDGVFIYLVALLKIVQLNALHNIFIQFFSKSSNINGKTKSAHVSYHSSTQDWA